MEDILFENTTLSTEMLQAISDMNYTEMTQIQSKAIPLILQGKDLIGRSNTGTGKTAAFGIPAVEGIPREKGEHPLVLVLCPTRELAMQISGELKKYARYMPWVKIATIYGGAPIPQQAKELSQANLVVGTPGRIMDHMRRKNLSLEHIRTVILDEADEMLNMGFHDDIETILQQTPEQRQTLLFSATMPPAILKLTKQFQKNPVIIAVDKGRRTLDAISQFYYYVPAGKKMDALNLVLQSRNPSRCVVFCNTRRMVDELVEYLNKHGFKAVGLHGDLRQNARTQIMNSFKGGTLNILVATDVAARGIDVEDVDAVFNFDIPQETEYYIHRIGRTGRAGKSGESYTFACNPTQARQVRNIARYIGAPIQECTLPSREELLQQRNDRLAARLMKALDKGGNERFGPIITQCAQNGYDAMAVGCALLSIIDGYDRHSIPTVKSMSVPGKKTAGKKDDSKWVRLSVNIGRKERIAPNFIVGAIVEATGVSPRAIGRIDIHNDTTEVALSPKEAA